MGQTFEAQLIGTDLKIAVVVGRFNEFITSKLLDGAMDGLTRHGVDPASIDVDGFQGLLKFLLLRNNWQKQRNMMPLLV